MESMPQDLEQNEGSGGGAGWIMTFADLMTLLLCFFVLMLSFSEMDVAKFKQLMGSMREAFGVQADIEANVIPKGTSVVAQEFSPGRPDPTPIDSVRQFTTNANNNSLDVGGDGAKYKWTKLAEEQAKRPFPGQRRVL